MSSITVIGNLVRNPEQKNGKTYQRTTLRIASNERVKDANGNWKDGDTTYIDVVCWSRLAQSALSLKKGQRVIVSGKLRGKEWQRNDGTTAYGYEISADDIGQSIMNGNSSKASSNQETIEILPELDNPWGSDGQ